MVQFTEIEIIELPVTRGVHPGCRKCPAIELSWEVQSRIVVSVDAYEVSRPRRRTGRQLLLSRAERVRMLQGNKISEKSTCKSSRQRCATKLPVCVEECHKQRIEDIEKKVEALMQRIQFVNLETKHEHSSACGRDNCTMPQRRTSLARAA